MKKSFNLDLGFGEDEVGLVFDPAIINDNSLNVFYRDGFYFLSDSRNNKILKITENGQVVLIIYNSTSNPQMIETVTREGDLSDELFAFIKLYKKYPLVSPDLITADIDKNIYIVDRNPLYKVTNEDNIIADNMIIKFGKKGEFLYELGTKGIDTTPFGKILFVLADNNNNVVIIENSIKKYNFYKFTNKGRLLIKTSINSNDIPLSKKESNYIVDIINISPGFIEDDIYITVQYVKKEIENFSISSYETLYEKIFKYSLKSNKISKLLLKNIPEYVNISKLKLDPDSQRLFGNKKEILQPMEDLIGIDTKDYLYLIRPDISTSFLNENRQKIFIYNLNGKLEKKKIIEYPLEIEFVSDIFLSPGGRLFSYYIKDGEIQFVNII